MFGDDIYTKQIQGYTELKKDNLLYQADINYCNKGCWFDNVMVLWESSDSNSIDDDSMIDDVSLMSTLIPAEIRMMFQMEGDGTFYALIHSCHEQSHKLLVLSYVWTKEHIGKTATKRSKHRPYECIDYGLDKKPVYQVIEMSSVHSHCLLLPLDATGN